MKSVPVMLLLLSLLAAQTAHADAPWFCHGLDCPKFTENRVKHNGVSLTLREYPEALWASTKVKDSDFNKAESTGFNRLFNYINGQKNNANHTAINMTCPVTNVITPSTGPVCGTDFTISFFVPFIYQTPQGPPAPTKDSHVFLDKISKKRFAVQQFGGFAQEKDVLKEAEKLYASLQAYGLKEKTDFEANSYIVSGYDDPRRVLNRHNEIWVEVFADL